MRNLVILALIFVSLSCSDKTELTPGIKTLNIKTDSNGFSYIYNHPRKDTSIVGEINFIDIQDSIKFRIRGSSSRDYNKKSLKLYLNSNSFNGSKKLNLNSEFTDKSYIRQYLSTELFKRSGQICFDSEHVIVNLNKSFFGIYLLVENMDGVFLKKNKLSIKGNLYKATHDGACMSLYDNIKLKWEKKTNKKESWDDLEILIKELNAIPSEHFDKWLKHTFNYDQVINYLAMNMILANGSTYYHNYYLYHDLKSKKWMFLPWDLDKSISYYSWMPYQHNKTSSNWESDNPLAEKALINDSTYLDIQKRIKELKSTLFTPELINPIVDSLELILSPYIDLDTSDKINSKKEWINQLQKEKKFITSHPDQILKQLQKYPRGFEIFSAPEYIPKDYVLKWRESKNSDSLIYKVLISEDFNFKSEVFEYKTKNLELKIPSGLNQNVTYFWKVIVENSFGKTEGFNTKNYFTIKDLTPVFDLKKLNYNLNKKGSPYSITSSITIPKLTTLIVDPDVIIYFSKNGKLNVKGDLKANGSLFVSTKKGGDFNSIEFFNSSNSILLNSTFLDVNFPIHSSRVEFKGCEFYNLHRELKNKGQRISLVWSNRGSVSIDNCVIIGNGTGEGCNLNYSTSVVKNNFISSIPDAIELIDVSDGVVSNNFVIASQDDAIDLNGCKNILISKNTLIYNKDKGISIGAEQYGKSSNILLDKNFISNNAIGVSVKDSSNLIIQNCTITNNKIGLEAYKKQESYKLGGKIELKINNIIKSNVILSKIDTFSEIKGL